MAKRWSGRAAGRRALVTGASTGIGAAFAAELARLGYDLLTVARDQGRLERHAAELRQRHGVAVQVLPADLTKPAELRAVEQAAAGPPAPDLLVNNAGCGSKGRYHELDAESETAQILLNVVALARLTRAALPGMVARGSGGIINVSSMVALIPAPDHATYGATKAFVNHFTESLSAELQHTGVTVQALCPGFTHTEFQARAGVDASWLPAPLWMTAEEVVAHSLESLDRGELFCIPGAVNQLMIRAGGLLPRPLLRLGVGVVTHRLLQKRR